jgi:hypothetical protein
MLLYHYPVTGGCLENRSENYPCSISFHRCTWANCLGCDDSVSCTSRGLSLAPLRIATKKEGGIIPPSTFLLPIPDGSCWSHFKDLSCVFWSFFCFHEIFYWIILIVISEIKSRVVNPNSFLYMKFSLELHTFERVCMNRSHEPTWLIGPNWYESEIKRRVFFYDFFCKITISRISCKIERFSSSL